MNAALLVLTACALDRWVGDPRWCPHPVQIMGQAIDALRRMAEAWAGDTPWRLRMAGVAITLVVVLGSTMAGWGLERLAFHRPALGVPLLLLGLASALAGGSLALAVRDVLAALPDQVEARQRLGWIVGRDVSALEERGILRAAAETAAENGVDGLFAPLFWMLVGAALSLIQPDLPGPLALAWAFKAASTLDSMMGYRHGRLRWLGTAGARLDDALTWVPARLVALSLPLAAGRPWQGLALLKAALQDGAPDPSPNAGVSQAAFAHAAGVCLGGSNAYAHGRIEKPLLAADGRPADRTGVMTILKLSARLEAVWLLLSMPGLMLLGRCLPLQPQ